MERSPSTVIPGGMSLMSPPSACYNSHSLPHTGSLYLLGSDTPARPPLQEPAPSLCSGSAFPWQAVIPRDCISPTSGLSNPAPGPPPRTGTPCSPPSKVLSLSLGCHTVQTHASRPRAHPRMPPGSVWYRNPAPGHHGSPLSPLHSPAWHSFWV